MKASVRFIVAAALLIASGMAFGVFWTETSAQSLGENRSLDARREEAYRANNLGVALLEQFNHKEAAEAFRRALQIDPKLKIAQVNFAIALFNVPDYVIAEQEARKAERIAPERPQPTYILGLIARAQNRADEALAAFKKVLEFDPQDVGANVNLGQVYMQQRRYAEAVAAFRVAVEAEPYNSTALYNLATALLREGNRAEGQQLMTRFQALRQSGAATSIGLNYLEQGRYAEAVTSTGAEAELVSRRTPEVEFIDATANVFDVSNKNRQRATTRKNAFGRTFRPAQFNAAAKREIVNSLSGSTLLFDFDADGDLDLFAADAANQKLYRNEKGKFVEATAQSGALAKIPKGAALGAVAGDFDNDEKPDLFVLRYGASSLYRNEGGGRFSDVTASAKIPNYPHLSVSAAFVDVDHDGDLDIFIAGLADLNKTGKKNEILTFPNSFAGAPHKLLRNNGDGTFVDKTGTAKLVGTAQNNAVAVVPFDYDNRRDIDLLVVNYAAAPQLFRNLRDETFRDVATEVGLDKRASGASVAAGDVNKDGFTDFFFGNGTFAFSDGKGKYSLSPAGILERNYSPSQFLDYDNDGLLDLITFADFGVWIQRNIGDRWGNIDWAGVKTRADKINLQFKENRLPRGFSSGDVDGDGDVDFIIPASPNRLFFARNNGGNLNRSVRVRLHGKVSNRSAVGAKVEARSGSLMQKLETYSASPAPAPADIIFGIGQRNSTDAIRVLWTAGIVQAETEASADKVFAASVTITELDRKPSSCPYLYTWNGEKFEFITDFMGGGELGYWVAPGVRAAPDSDEYVRIRGDQLKERDGRFEIRVTNELEEALFMDKLKLLAVAHPKGTEVFPNEGLGNPTASVFKLYATENARPPLSATDNDGSDALERIGKIDRRYPDNFKLHRIRGYAEEHSLTLDLGATNAKRILLLLNGWTDYAFSSDNVAAAQSGMSLRPPALQVKDASGNWKTVIENIGVPVGRPQTVTVDLTGKFLSANREVRIVTNMRIYWDEILVDASGGEFPAKIETLEPVIADLRWRGFSAETTPDGREPFGYDYDKVSPFSPWKTFPGRYTREGDVRELLENIDDMFVVSRPGDEISISFDATKLEPLADGWTRTFLLYADGFSKEMDINSASPDQVSPLPFHAMKNYPYQPPETYPLTPEREKYLETYNTRVVKTPLPRVFGGKRNQW